MGVALALLATAVLMSARHFPNVPGQKIGAAFLPMLVGAGLLVCGLALVWRAWRTPPQTPAAAPAEAVERIAPALGVMGSVLLYIVAAERLGFLLVAPFVLLLAFKSLQVAWRPSLMSAVLGSLLVHVAFYKLLRVPLPWGVLRPFY